MIRDATLAIRPAPELAPGATRYVVDCAHGRTEAVMMPGREPLPDAVCVRMAITRHYDAEGCACTAALRRRYGVAP